MTPSVADIILREPHFSPTKGSGLSGIAMKFPFGRCLYGSEVPEQAPDVKCLGYDESFSHQTKTCMSSFVPALLDRCAASSSDE